MSRAITSLDESVPNSRQKTRKRRVVKSTVVQSEPATRPGWNQFSLLVGYEQGLIAGMVDKRTKDITTFGGEESYAELDAFLSHRHPNLHHHLRQTLILAILRGAREAAMYAEHLWRLPGGSSSDGSIKRQRNSSSGSRAVVEPSGAVPRDATRVLLRCLDPRR